MIELGFEIKNLSPTYNSHIIIKVFHAFKNYQSLKFEVIWYQSPVLLVIESLVRIFSKQNIWDASYETSYKALNDYKN